MKDSVCCICLDDQKPNDNPLFTCEGKGCGVIVHKGCYGVQRIPEGIWFCRKCESQERVARVRCELCPSRDGALKRTDKGGWCHVVCALFMPDAEFLHHRTMEPIILDKVSSDRMGKMCSLCEKNNRMDKMTYGGCIQCSKPGCKTSFHITCAQSDKLLVEEKDGRCRSANYVAYCSQHTCKKKTRGFPSLRPQSESPMSSAGQSESSGPPPITSQLSNQSNASSVNALTSNSTLSSGNNQSTSGSTSLPNVLKRSDSAHLLSPSPTRRKSVTSDSAVTTSSSDPVRESKPRRAKDPKDETETQNPDSDNDQDDDDKKNLDKSLPKMRNKKGQNKISPNRGLAPVSLTLRRRVQQLSGLPKAPLKRGRKQMNPNQGQSGAKRRKKENDSLNNDNTMSNSSKQRHSATKRLKDGMPNLINPNATAVSRRQDNLEPPKLLPQQHISFPCSTNQIQSLHSGPSRPRPMRDLDLLEPSGDSHKLSSNILGDSGDSKSRGCLTMEELLEWQWDQAGTLLMQQAENTDIVSLLSCLHQLKKENDDLELKTIKLLRRRDHLRTVNGRLAVCLSDDTKDAATKIQSANQIQGNGSHLGATTSQLPCPTITTTISNNAHWPTINAITTAVSVANLKQQHSPSVQTNYVPSPQQTGQLPTQQYGQGSGLSQCYVTYSRQQSAPIGPHQQGSHSISYHSNSGPPSAAPLTTASPSPLLSATPHHSVSSARSPLQSQRLAATMASSSANITITQEMSNHNKPFSGSHSLASQQISPHLQQQQHQQQQQQQQHQQQQQQQQHQRHQMIPLPSIAQLHYQQQQHQVVNPQSANNSRNCPNPLASTIPAINLNAPPKGFSQLLQRAASSGSASFSLSLAQPQQQQQFQQSNRLSSAPPGQPIAAYRPNASPFQQ